MNIFDFCIALLHKEPSFVHKNASSSCHQTPCDRSTRCTAKGGARTAAGSIAEFRYFFYLFTKFVYSFIYIDTNVPTFFVALLLLHIPQPRDLLHNSLNYLLPLHNPTSSARRKWGTFQWFQPNYSFSAFLCHFRHFMTQARFKIYFIW